ncbi:MAG: hypothetical protein H6582_00995 [Crocinitomicaceae bacterium]|nr:hypothetical protein [Crocinitomicaceae bacterium]
MKNWTKKQIFITSIGYIGLLLFACGFLLDHNKLKDSTEKLESMEIQISSEKNNYSLLEKEYKVLNQEFESMAYELDSLYFIVDVDGSILEEKNKQYNLQE